MKTKLLSMLTLLLFLGVGLTTCDKVSDADLKETADRITASIDGTSDVTVVVDKQIATLSGVVEYEATKQKVASWVSAIEGMESVVNNITVVPPPPIVMEPAVKKATDQLIVATRKGKLNVHNKPGVEEYVITVVEHGETLTLLDKTSDKWWRIKTERGVEGYCYSRPTWKSSKTKKLYALIAKRACLLI